MVSIDRVTTIGAGPLLHGGVPFPSATPSLAMGPHPLRSLFAEEGAAALIARAQAFGSAPFYRMPLELAFAHGSDGTDYHPLVGPAGTGRTVSGLLGRPMPLRLWQCGDLRGEVIERDGGFHVAIQVPDCADPLSRHDLERVFFVYLQVAWEGDPARFVTSLLSGRSSQYEVMPLSLNGAAPRTMGQWSLAYWRLLAGERIAARGEPIPTHMQPKKELELAAAMAVYRSACPALRATFIGDGATPTCEPLSTTQQTDFTAYVAACIARKRHPLSHPQPPLLPADRPPTKQTVRAAAVEMLVEKYFTAKGEESGAASTPPRRVLTRLFGTGVTFEAMDAALTAARDRIAALLPDATWQARMEVLYMVVYDLPRQVQSRVAEALTPEAIHVRVATACRPLLEERQREQEVALAPEAIAVRVATACFPTAHVHGDTWMHPSHPVVMLRELLLRNTVFDPDDATWCDATLRAAWERIQTEGSGLDALRQAEVLRLVLESLSHVAMRRPQRARPLRELDGMALLEKALADAWREERRWAMVCALARARLGGQRLATEVAAFVAPAHPVVLTTQGVAGIRAWADDLATAWCAADPAASVQVVRQLLGEQHCAAIAAEDGVPPGYQFQAMHVVATWLRKGETAVAESENWLRYFFAGWRARDLTVISRVLAINDAGEWHRITIRVRRQGLSDIEYAVRQRQVAEYAVSLPWATVEDPDALGAAVAEAVQAIHAFARTQRTSTVSRPVRAAQPGRSVSVSTAAPTPSASVLPQTYLEYIDLEVARTVHHAPSRPAIVAAVVRNLTTMHARQALPVELTDAMREQIQDRVRAAVEWMRS